MWNVWSKTKRKGVIMGRKKKEVVVEEPVVIEEVVIEVPTSTVPEGASVVTENLGVDPNDPRTRSDR